MPQEKISIIAKDLIPARAKLCTGVISKYQAPLSPLELAHSLEMDVHRAREFTAGRTIAKNAASKIGISIPSLGKGRDGCPIWPKTVVGSISHKAGFCGALVADSRIYIAAGFDIELVESLEKEVWSVFATEEEVMQAGNCKMEESKFANLLFSCKEAFFKALYPLLGSDTPTLNRITISTYLDNNHIVTETLINKTNYTGFTVFDARSIMSWVLVQKNV